MARTKADATKQVIDILAETMRAYSKLLDETNLINAKQFLEFFMDIDRKCISAMEKNKIIGVPIDLHTDIHTSDHLLPHRSVDSTSLASILRFITKEQRHLQERVEKIIGGSMMEVGTVEDSVLRTLQRASMKGEIIYSEIIQKQY